MSMSYSYYPGCSLRAVGLSYTESLEYIAGKIGMELIEIDDWNCCGTSAASITSDNLMYALPARSLALSEQQNPGLDVVAPCTGCFISLKGAVRWSRSSEANRAHVCDLIEMDYKASADVKSLLEVMLDSDVSKALAGSFVNTLNGMKVACYYGCAQVRPEAVAQFDDPENPTSMELLLNATGAECVDWSFKTECCGASHHVIDPKTARGATERILRNAVANGAEAIATCCPLCWMNLDMRQPQINAEYGTDYHIPVFYFTELVALACGASPSECGIGRHFEPAVDFANSHVEKLEAETVEESQVAAGEVR